MMNPSGTKLSGDKIVPQSNLQGRELTVIWQWKEWLAIIPDGKPPFNQKIERREGDSSLSYLSLLSTSAADVFQISKKPSLLSILSHEYFASVDLVIIIS